MDPRTLDEYVRRLGLKPASAGQLLSEDGSERPWRVATVDRGQCTVLGIDDERQLVERKVHSGAQPVAVGDWVVLEAPDPSAARVGRILERTTWLERGSAHRQGVVQLIAANLDTVFIVVAFAETDKLEGRSLNARRLDRFIAAVTQGGATPVVVLNKVDLARRTAEELAGLRAELAARLGGVEVLCVGALDRAGLDALSVWLSPAHTVAFIGPSGVGKSSLVNALLGEERQQVRSVRQADTKGRHATTRRQLVMLPGGALLIDTPGVREFAVVGDDAAAGFADIDGIARGCRFGDCGHDSEPACAVRDAVRRGELSAERLQSYRDIDAEARRLSAKQDPHARHLARNEQRRFGRMVKGAKTIKDRQG